MEKTIKINYRWNLDDYSDISFETKELLQQEAESRILDMRKQGCTYGELVYEDDEMCVYGWWNFSYTIN